RLNQASRHLDPVTWPASMSDWREQFGERGTTPPDPAMVIRRLAPTIWDSVPALVVPLPYVIVNERVGASDVRFSSQMSYSVLEIDRDYVTRDLLPSLATQHFRATGDDVDYQVAVVSHTDGGRVVFHSTPSFSPRADDEVDRTVEFFQVRTQDFGTLA